MSDDEIKIVISEQQAYAYYPPQVYGVNPTAHRIAWENSLPNYPCDLNAIAEAVKTLEAGFDGSQTDDYQQTLWSIVNPGVQWEQPEDEPQPLYDVGYLQNFVEATARQRAEAFIKTVCPEKWKGDA